MPANLRFAHYGSWDKVKFENKFAPVPLIVPLNKSLDDSFKAVPPVTRLIRDHFIDIYGTYAMTYYFTMFAPYFVLDYFLMKSTAPYTLAFSNTPGLLKPIQLEQGISHKMHFYFIPSGLAGMGLACISYVNFFKFTLTTDDSIMKEP